ncbi:MAG: putative multidrug efflux protein AdeT1 [Aquirhabdus sp.]
MRRRIAAALFMGLSLSGACAAESKLTLCIFDPTGQNGYAYGYAKDYILQAPRFGLNNPIEIKIYTSESLEVKDFETGRCDAAIMSNLRARQFNSFTGSLDAIGAIQSVKDLSLALQVLSSKELAPKMSQGSYEVVGIIPIGAAYMMVDDRRINTFGKAKNLKIAELNLEQSMSKLTQKVGGQPVPVTLATISNAFNTHQVNVLGSPAVAFQPLEFAKGMTAANGTIKGGVIRYRMAQITAAFIVNKKKLPNPEVNQKIREYIYSQIGTAYRFIDNAEKGIDDKYWVNLSPIEQQSNQALMRSTRIEMTKEGIYNKDMMHLLKSVRCKTVPTNAECAMNDE